MNRSLPLFLIAVLTASALRAQTDPFVGRWKLTRLTDQMKVTNLGGNTYAFDFGGGPETIVVDGSAQPGTAGTTLSVGVEGAKWKVIRKKAGRVLLTATWSLSREGNVLQDDFTNFNQDGSPSEIKYLYERRASGSGFAGTWVSTTTAIGSPILLEVRPYENDGLSFVVPSAKQTVNVHFDGHDARRLNARTLEIARRSGSKVMQTRQYLLSGDLKTLTMTVRLAGKAVPNVYVFERQ